MKRRIVNEKLIERLKLLHAKSNKTFDEVEVETGISKGSLSKYMNGLHLPNSDVIRRLTNYWDVSADYLLGTSDIKERVRKELIPTGYLLVCQKAMNQGITEEEFKEMFEMMIKFKRGDHK